MLRRKSHRFVDSGACHRAPRAKQTGPARGTQDRPYDEIFRRCSRQLRPPIEELEHSLPLQLAWGLVLDSLPFFIGGLDVASNVLIPAFGYRGRQVEIELVVNDRPNSRIAVNLDAFRRAERAESAIFG
jgi:hypothetical protein